MTDRDDDRTRLATERELRTRRSSVTVATAELLVERIVSELRVSPLPPARREAIAELLVEWCRQRLHRALAVERREADRLRGELDRERRDNARLRNLMRTEE